MSRFSTKEIVEIAHGGYFVVKDENIEATCTIEYSLTGANINSGVATSPEITTISGDIMFRDATAGNGWDYLVKAGLVQSNDGHYALAITSKELHGK